MGSRVAQNLAGIVNDPFTHSPFTHSLIHSFTHSLIHPFTHSPIHSFTHSLIHSFTHSPIHPFTHSLIHHSRFTHHASRITFHASHPVPSTSSITDQLLQAARRLRHAVDRLSFGPPGRSEEHTSELQPPYVTSHAA